MKSLLNKTLTHFIICAVIVLLLSTPIFYLLTKNFYAEDMIDLMQAMQRGEKAPAQDFERDLIQGIMIQFFLIFSALSCSVFITLRLTTRKLWQPFDNTLKKMEHFNLEQNINPEFIATDIKEFQRLNQSVALLIKRNKESYRTQKEFTENASHELQTPLAVAQAKLDLLIQEDLNKKQSEIVNDLYTVFKRMRRLNKNLLLLARIENAQYTDMQQIDLCEFIQNRIYLFDYPGGYQSSVILKKTSPSLIIKANEVLLESLINNLVVNAMRHSSDNFVNTVEIKDRCLTVSNIAVDGPLDEKLLFCRFKFTDNKKRGNGLGLSIMKAVCDFHGWTITYRYQNKYHSFIVDFPTITAN